MVIDIDGSGGEVTLRWPGDGKVHQMSSGVRLEKRDQSYRVIVPSGVWQVRLTRWANPGTIR